MSAIVLRFTLAAVLPRAIRDDETSYLLLGRDLLTGQGFSEVHYTPLYPLMSGALYLLVGDFEWASNLIYAICGGLLLFPVFGITRRIYGAQTAALTTLLLTIFPALNVSVLYWGTMTEPLYLCLVYGGLATLLRGLEDERAWIYATSGALFGLAYLARPEGIVYFGTFVVVLIGLGLQQAPTQLRSTTTRRTRWRHWHVPQIWRAAAVFVVSFLLLAAPYVWYLHGETGRWMITGKLNMTGEAEDALVAGDYVAYHRETSKLWNSPERFQHGLLSAALADPRRFVRRLLINGYHLGRFFSWRVFSFGLIPFLAVALFQSPWDRQRLRYEAFLLAALLPLLAFLALHIEIRFLAPAFPVLLMWTARGALNLGVWLQDTLTRCRARPVSERLKTVLGWVPACVVVLVFAVIVTALARIEPREIPFGYKEAGLWLRTHTPADATVMTRAQGSIKIYADRHTIPSRDIDVTSLLAYAHAHNATYFVVDDYELTRLNPQLAFLMEPKELPPDLELLFSVQEPRYRTFVYRIHEKQPKRSRSQETELDALQG